ncbi:Rv1535 family protein [Mycobacterium sp.]|uniref:Rv1535 family protein n=1 Tax=Mycobacterium sp. TaxID=1785 RepID=UPI002C338BE2|nr:Rv1535 family protein [Mycobacterium sp.]HTQ19197.1 Rv1535 family protein [Mycobacterium sp.]
MTAALIDDVVLTAAPVTPPAPRLKLAPQPKRVSKLRHFEPPSDPMADVAGHLLSFPLRHIYAALWRVGVIEVTA